MFFQIRHLPNLLFIFSTIIFKLLILMFENMDVMATTNNAGNLGLIQPIAKCPGAESGIQLSPFTNGVLKRHKTLPILVGDGGGVVYKECLKNHAASLGGHALDGCGEFMPAHTATATDPTSLRCAACGCHRNFHRLERVSSGCGVAEIEYRPQKRHHPLGPPVLECETRSPGSDNNSPPPISSTFYPASAPHMLLALSSGGNTTPTPTSTNGKDSPKKNKESEREQVLGGKRFRTKFSQEQKEKMLEFAEKIGWKLQKSSLEMVKGFCHRIQVHRDVFKVWMHNNKNTLPKTSTPTPNYLFPPLKPNPTLHITNDDHSIKLEFGVPCPPSSL